MEMIFFKTRQILTQLNTETWKPRTNWKAEPNSKKEKFLQVADLAGNVALVFFAAILQKICGLIPNEKIWKEEIHTDLLNINDKIIKPFFEKISNLFSISPLVNGRFNYLADDDFSSIKGTRLERKSFF